MRISDWSSNVCSSDLLWRALSPEEISRSFGPALKCRSLRPDRFWPTQDLPVESDPFEPVVQAKQVGESHSAVYFGGSACDKSMDLGRVRFRMAGDQRCLVRHRVEGVGGVPDERTARFMTRGHLGAHMLYGLETADQAAELFALASIIDSLFDHRLTCAKTVGGQANTARSEEHTS